MFDFRKLQKQPGLPDKTKKMFVKLKTQTPDSLDKYEFVTVGAKAYDYTKINEVFLKS